MHDLAARPSGGLRVRGYGAGVRVARTLRQARVRACPARDLRGRTRSHVAAGRGVPDPAAGGDRAACVVAGHQRALYRHHVHRPPGAGTRAAGGEAHARGRQNRREGPRPSRSGATHVSADPVGGGRTHRAVRG